MSRYDDVVLASGSSIREKYSISLEEKLLDVGNKFYSTYSTFQSYKTRYGLYENQPGKFVFYSSGKNGKDLYHALSVRINSL